VLAVDANDAGGPEHVKNNGLSFISVWGESAVQLQFANNVYGSDDIVPDAGALILRDGSGNTVDAVEYDASVAAPFQSIERGDPSADTDDDNDGYFDGWFASSAIEKATPGRMNRNVGSQIIDEKTLEVRYHDISEQKIVSPAGKSIAAITGIPSSFSWQRCTLRDAAFLADKVTESETLLSLSEAWEEGSMGRSGTGFQTDAAGQVGSWLFSGVAPGSYEFALVCGAASSAGVTATITEAGGKRQLVSLLPQNGLLYLGSVTVGESGTLGLKLVNESGGGAELQRAVLYPAEYVRGKININTAPSDVLSIFFGSLSADLIAGRPYGEQDTRMLGVGDLLSGSAAAKFSEAYDRASKILTVRSNAYGVRVRGEAVGGHKATHEISTVIEK